MARKPAKFSQARFEQLLDRIREGETIEEVTADPTMPARLTLYRWLREGTKARREFDQALADRNTTWKDRAVALYRNLLERLERGEDVSKDEVTSAKAFASFLTSQAARTERIQATQQVSPSSPGGAIRVELVTYADAPDDMAVPDDPNPQGDPFDEDPQ